MNPQFFRFLGRLFIITLLLTSAILKIGDPQSYKKSVKNTYTKTKSIFPFLDFLPKTQQLSPYLNKIILGLAVLQGISALLILFGDKLGGIIFTIAIIIGQISINGYAMSQILRFSNVDKIFQMGPFFCLLGIGLLLCDTNYIRRKAKN